MTNIIILDESTMMSAEVRDAIASLTAAIVREKNSEITSDITGIPVPHNWGEIQGYGHKKEAMSFIETLATELADEEDDGHPRCFQDIMDLEIEFLNLKLEIAKKLKNSDIDQKVMSDIWDNIEKCSSIQELKDIVF